LLPILNIVPLGLDSGNFAVLLRLLVLVLVLEKTDTLLEMNLNNVIDFPFGVKYATEPIDFLLQLGLLLLVETVFT